MSEPTKVMKYTLVSRETMDVYVEVPKDLYPWRYDICELMGIDKNKWKVKDNEYIKLGVNYGA